MGIGLLQNEIASGFKRHVYLITYEDDFIYALASKTIAGALNDSQLDIYDLEDTLKPVSITGVIDSLNTVSMFSSKKIVAIRNYQKAGKAITVQVDKYAKNPSPDSTLILFYKGSSKKAQVQGAHTISLDITRKELPAWIKNGAKERRITISDDAVTMLSNFFGDNIGILDNEIEKLSLLGKKDIRRQDIEEIFYGEKDVSPFVLTTAISEGNKKSALKTYTALSGRIEPYQLFGAINWELSRLRTGVGFKGKVPAKKPVGDIARRADTCFKILVDSEVRLRSTNPNLPIEWTILRMIEVLSGK